MDLFLICLMTYFVIGFIGGVIVSIQTWYVTSQIREALSMFLAVFFMWGFFVLWLVVRGVMKR